MKQEIKTTQPDSKKGLHTQGDAFEKQEFFDLMQQYRIAPMTEQERVIKSYESVKEYIRNERKALLDSHKELLENLERILDRIGENGYQHDFPSAYERAIIALNNAKNI